MTHPDDKTTVITLKDGPKFTDGKPVTADDVLFSLQRAADPKGGGFYPQVFSRVASMKKTSDKVVTISLKEPDFWLDGELSQMPGVVVQKAFAESKGRKFGTPQGGTMCAGPYKVGSWKAGSTLNAVANKDYWDTSHKPKVAEIDFKGVPDDSSMTSGLLTGGIDGSYVQGLSTIDQLKAAKDKVSVFEGPSFASDAIVLSNLKGALKDVRVRQALSLAIDRKAYIQNVYHGAAQLPRTLANPGTWGYGKDVFQADWDKLPDPNPDIAKAKDLMKQAGAAGKTITLGMTTEVAQLNTAANAIRQAGQAIGLKVNFKAVSAQNFINFFTDPKAREGIDGFPTVNYPDYADPAGVLQHDRDAGRQPELLGLRRPADHEGDERCPLDGRPGRAREVRRPGGRPDHGPAAVDPDGGDQHDADHHEQAHRGARVLRLHGRPVGEPPGEHGQRQLTCAASSPGAPRCSSRRCSSRASSSSARWTSRRATRWRR